MKVNRQNDYTFIAPGKCKKDTDFEKGTVYLDNAVMILNTKQMQVLIVNAVQLK